MTHPPLPEVGGYKIPGSGWVDPDCQYYGNCDSSELKGVEFTRKPTAPFNRWPGINRLSRR